MNSLADIGIGKDYTNINVMYNCTYMYVYYICVSYTTCDTGCGLWEDINTVQSVTVPRIFFGTGTGTFFRDQFFPVPVPVPSKKRENSRDRDKTGTIWDFFKRLRN